MTVENTDYEYKNNKYTIDEELREKILRYLCISKKFIFNNVTNKDEENKIIAKADELLDIFMKNQNKIYYLNRQYFIEKVNKTKYFGADYYIQKVNYIEDKLIIMEFIYIPNGDKDGNKLITFIMNCKDDEWYIDEHFQFHRKMLIGKDNDKCIDQEERLYDKNVDALYENDILNEEKLVDYILNLDIIKSYKFITKEEIIEMLTIVEDNKVKDFRKFEYLFG